MNPSLLLIPDRYKAEKLYSQIPDSGAGDLDFTRVGDTATRVNSAGLIEPVLADIPRIDYTGGGCGKLLLEPQRANLALYSQDFGNASWIKQFSTIGGTTNSPEGIANAVKLQETASTEIHRIEQNATVSNGQEYSFSVFAKKAERNFIAIYEDSAGAVAWFNLDLGIVGTTGGGAVAYIEPWENGFFRCSIRYIQTGTTGRLRIAVALQDLELSYAGTAGNGVFIYGAQLEAGSYATSYIPTLDATVTRGADAASKTGISSLIGQSEGVFYFDAANLFLSGSRSIALAFTSGAAYYQIYLNASNQVRVDVNGSLLLLGGTIVENTRYKIAVAYKAGDNALYINGTQIATSASTTIPASLNDFYLGNSLGTEQSGSYNASALYTTRLSNAELASITTL
jgi:hypothetical protein